MAFHQRLFFRVKRVCNSELIVHGSPFCKTKPLRLIYLFSSHDSRKSLYSYFIEVF
ncbi:hypothetical protein SynSYN20_01034 [Synechococcus sp. SYN20]|nr:hypothetical protein SynSYN20_01034 [Synechococcus sp. SYN20]